MSATRYFTDGYDFWKFVPGQAPQNRDKEESTWDESGFGTLEEFLECSGEVTEVTEEEAEP